MIETGVLAPPSLRYVRQQHGLGNFPAASTGESCEGPTVDEEASISEGRQRQLPENVGIGTKHLGGQEAAHPRLNARPHVLIGLRS